MENHKASGQQVPYVGTQKVGVIASVHPVQARQCAISFLQFILMFRSRPCVGYLIPTALSSSPLELGTLYLVR
jgi:hypothetical protein